MAEDRKGIASFGVSFGEGGAKRGVAESAPPTPFRITVVSELVAGPEYSTGRAIPLDPIAIDIESFDRVMGQVAPALAIEVDDPFGGREPPLRIDLVFRDRKGFRPNEIVEQVPALRALVAARQLVQDVTSRKLSAETARGQLARILPRPSWIDSLVQEVRSAPIDEPTPHAPVARPAAAPTPSPAPAPTGGGLDALLDMVDVSAPAEPEYDDDAPTLSPPAPPPEAQSALARMVADVARSARPAPAPRAVVGTAPQRLEGAFRGLLDSIIRHPEVERLEATWRGLRLLIEQCDRKKGVEVDLLCAGRDDVATALDRLSEPDASRAPVDLIVVDQRVEPIAVDLARLEKWAGLAAGLLAPLVVAGSAEMLGVDSLAKAAQSSSSLSTSDDGRAVALRAVASREDTRWISLVINDPLVRAPYTTETSRQQTPAFSQDPHDPDALVFANGAYLVGALCARNHGRLGWPAAITSARDGTIGNLPVHTISDRGREAAIPLRAIASEDAVKEAARAGVTMLACAVNTDSAVLSRAPMLHRGSGGNAAADATLSDQLFVGRFARAVQQVAGAIPRGTDAKRAEEVARIALMELFESAAPPGPEIVTRVDAAGSALNVTVRPRRFAGVQMEELTLGAALG